ncbi:TonB-dependent receptor [Sphingomicrobium flavum]|uniref:TonB-dependent receptor n=1 Tax=Sphingomicrobium flavum TaxID=1229164 RepID=UPI0021AD6CAF|nr:TonB-dependent receptor [Sphingomicrobium flavum]
MATEFKKFLPFTAARMLGTASSFAMCMAMAQPALAQDAQPEEEEGTDAPVTDEEDTIVITGFLKSLETAQNIKRDSDTFVDAITAEDIGALPDRSVAESLQRVPGVNIGRFEKTSDPDRFSVEGTGVIIRGLPYVRSELNGRDIFSATGGRVLSFNDVSPELLGRVEVFKNVTADMIEGGIAGTVNLVTRKPLDNPGPKLAGTIEATVGDMAKEWSPGFSVLASDTFEFSGGTIGIQAGYAQSELISRTDASQVTDPCYRPADLSGGCFRALTVVDGGFSGDPVFDASNFPPAGSIIVPKGAGVRTTELERDRRALSLIGQIESNDGRFLATLEYLRAETEFFTDEYAILAQVNNDGEFPEPRAGTDWVIDSNGVFQSGILTQNNAGGYASLYGGVRTETLRFQRATEADTEDFSLDIDFLATDRLSLNLEIQHINSDLSRDAIIAAMNQWSDIALDLTGDTPSVEFLAPLNAPQDILASGDNTYYWFLLDSIEDNNGDLYSAKIDAEYDIGEGFIRKARFGARWADRDRVTRNTNFSTWGNLSAPWTGRGGCAPWGGGPGCYTDSPILADWSGFTPGRLYTGLPGQEFATAGGAFVDEFPSYSQARDPFSDFQRGNASDPTSVPLFFFGGDDLLGEYLAGDTRRQGQEINTFSQTPNPFFGVQDREFLNSTTREVTACTPYCPPEISDVQEITKAAYARVDFGHEFAGGATIDGNVGVRYVSTRVKTGGLIGFPNPFFFDTGPAGNNDGATDADEIFASCAFAPPDQPIPGYCLLSPERRAVFADAFSGEVINDTPDVTFDHWLPSLNVKFEFKPGMLVRGAVSKGITRPELNLFSAGGSIGDNTGVLRDSNTLETGPLFVLNTGNRGLRPIESWNYDLSFEWYWDDVGSITLSGFIKDIEGVVTGERPLLTYTTESGASLEAETVRPANLRGGTLKGFEVAYQQVYDFLPGPFDGLGAQLTYTYVDGGDFNNTNANARQGLFVAQAPLEGISEHTVNATLFYEKGPFAARAAYNWRSDFLITASDDIWPYSPIYQESTGQLDASLFYSVTDDIKVGVQGVNLLDEVTETSQVIDFDGTRITRSAFRNDRRFTFLVRFDF